MIRYLLEVLVIQGVFLLTYDLFLKKETFFQWNRGYLMAAFLLSLILPRIKIEALKTEISPENLLYHTPFVSQPDTIGMSAMETPLFWEVFSIYHWIFLLGATVMTFWFLAKLYRILRLRQKGIVTHYPHFTKVMVQKSGIVFSFFKMVFLGDTIAKEKQPQILAHELVHIKQWHSLDLLFFELMRILFWFNPLTYVYQSRMAELHEFIADAQVAKKNRKKQYQLLLSETFQTHRTSFINPFYKKSQLNKRIAMLTKQKSKKVYRLKYGLFLPLALGMLAYTSCEQSSKEEGQAVTIKAGLESEVAFGIIEQVPIFPGCEGAADTKACFMENIQEHIRKHFNYPQEAKDQGIQGRVSVMFTIDNKGNVVDIRKRGPHPLLEEEVERIIQRLPKMQPGEHKGESVNVPFSIPVVFRLSDENALSLEIQKFGQRGKDWTPFAQLDHAPVFPGCENTSDTKGCFLERVQEHIRKHFNYPQEARDLGIQGRVAVMFTIDTDGNITDIKKRGPSPLLEAEVERIIARLPRMQPGRHKGKAVNVPFSLPITFKL